ncbi:MAG: MBL fold metallo-hydrolase [Bradymonadaceae bacterium]
MLTRLWTFHCGHAPVPRALLESGESWEIVRMPLLGALVEHDSMGPILIDAPLGRRGLEAVGSGTATTMDLLGFEFSPEWGVVGRIEEIGFAPEDVGRALFTHLHVDHTGGMPDLPGTLFYSARREWDLANHLPDFRAKMEGYIPSLYESRYEQVELFDRPDPFSEDRAGLDLFGDGSIRVVSFPGHTPYHVGFRLTFADGEEYLHVGDAAFTLEQITRARPLGPMPRSFAEDVDLARTTLKDLRSFHARFDDVSLVNAHDPGLGAECRDAPALVHEAR